MIEAGEALHVYCRVLGEPSGFSEIDLASHAADLGCQRRDNGKGPVIQVLGGVTEVRHTSNGSRLEAGVGGFLPQLLK